MTERLFILAAIVLAVFAEEYWQAYVDQQLVLPGRISKGAIVSLDGSILAKSPDLQMSAQEAVKLTHLMSNPVSGFASGYVVERTKYFVIMADPFVAGKLGTGGFFACKTNEVIVFGLYEEGQLPGPAAQVVNQLADHFKEQVH